MTHVGTKVRLGWIYDREKLFIFVFWAHLYNPKGHVRYFHHLASVVVRKSSSLKPLGQLEPNLVWLFIGWSPTKFMFLLLIRGTQKKQEAQRCQKSVSIYIGINYLLFIWFWRWFFNTLKKNVQKHAYRYYVTITVFDIKGVKEGGC